VPWLPGVGALLTGGVAGGAVAEAPADDPAPGQVPAPCWAEAPLLARAELAAGEPSSPGEPAGALEAIPLGGGSREYQAMVTVTVLPAGTRPLGDTETTVPPGSPAWLSQVILPVSPWPRSQLATVA
jgi:hypothetical protein